MKPIPLWLCRWTGSLLILWSLPGAYATQHKGHTDGDNRILINSSSHWEAWDVDGGIAAITADGSVRPNFMRKDINAALGAEKFSATGMGGVIAASNPGDAPHVIDGDMSTTWGPDLDDPQEDWSITVQLGRLVVARRIVLRFADVGEGDPFLKFKVMVWRQGPAALRQFSQEYVLRGSDIPLYWEIGRNFKPNKTERVFEFVPPTLQGGDGTFVGDPIESVHIVVTDSDFDLAQQVSREEYDALADEAKGAVEYYRRLGSGRQIRTSEAGYGAIPVDQRGPIRYYRRERPRLAEVEVWTAGENFNLGTTRRGGRVTLVGSAETLDASSLTDGDYSTGATSSLFAGDEGEYWEDLGALFWIDTMQFLMDGDGLVDEIDVDISDGTLAPDGSIQWTRAVKDAPSARLEEPVETSIIAGRTTTIFAAIRYREFRINPARVNFIRARFRDLAGTSWISFNEVLLYGRGFVPEVVVTSDLIDLGGNKNLISVEWEADTPAGTRVEVQTRTGDTLLEESIFYDSRGNEVTEAKYNRLPGSKKGDIVTSLKPDSDWIPWSAPYEASGEEIRSPSPREYLLVRARLLSNDPEAAATLHAITVNMSDPLADELVGEIWPNRIQATGQDQDVSFFIRPAFGSGRQGFDEIMIEATSGAMELIEVRAGSDQEFDDGQPEVLSRAEVEVLAEGADTLWLRLPETISRGIELIEIGFRASMFSNSTSFRGSIRDSGNPGVWQRVDDGDATDLVHSQVTTIVALGGNLVIENLHLDSEVLSPNGDGINDELVFHFDVLRVSAVKDVRVTIYDLSGRRVGEAVERRPDPRGRYALVWEGRDASGKVVTPGIYIARAEVETDSDSARQTSIDRVVYIAY